jgi:hypothetical protein
VVSPVGYELDDDEEKQKPKQDSFDPSERSSHTVSFARFASFRYLTYRYLLADDCSRGGVAPSHR